jgi:hypothetical protein
MGLLLRHSLMVKRKTHDLVIAVRFCVSELHKLLINLKIVNTKNAKYTWTTCK